MTNLLEGCFAKIQRAEENIKNLNSEINTFFADNPRPYRITTELRNNGLQYAFVAFGTAEIDARYSVLAGEVIHHLRSSLDHLFGSLIRKNGCTPTRRDQFPIYTSCKKKVKKACASGLIERISISAQKIIAGVQPYTRTDPDDDILYVIQQFDNLDKHDLLLVVSTVAQIGNSITIKKTDGDVIIDTLAMPVPHKITENGVVVFSIGFARPVTKFEADAQFVSQIAFENCGRAKLAPVVQTLQGMLQYTVQTVNLFSGEF